MKFKTKEMTDSRGDIYQMSLDSNGALDIIKKRKGKTYLFTFRSDTREATCGIKDFLDENL